MLSATFTARSPIRSRSLFIFSIAHDEPQLVRHRLMKSENLQAILLDVDLKPVYVHVAIDHSSEPNSGISALNGLKSHAEAFLQPGRREKWQSSLTYRYLSEVLSSWIQSFRSRSKSLRPSALKHLDSGLRRNDGKRSCIMDKRLKST